jgi:gas vesicle protein
MIKKATKNLAIGTAIAAATGYIAGILTAPKSGKETRKDIQDTALKAKTEAEKRLKKAHSELSELVEKGKTHTAQLQDSAKAQYTALLTRGQAAKEKARDILSSVHEGTADDKDLQKAIKEVNAAIDSLKSYLDKNIQNVKEAAKK